ncbi:MAG TPA: ATP-binding protein, partial [Bacteroidales bacterium]
NYTFNSPIGTKYFEAVFVPETSTPNQVETILLTNSDITDNVNRERELSSSKKQLEEAEKNVHFGIFEIDLVTGISHWSNEMNLILERDPQLQPPSMEECEHSLHPDDVEMVKNRFTEAIENGNNVNINFRINTATAKTKYVNCTGRIDKSPENEKDVKIIGTLMDITEKKQIETRLFSERDVLQAIIDNVPDLIYIKDRQGRFIRVNKSLARAVNISNPEDLIGKTVFDIFPRETAEGFFETDEAILNSGISILNNEKKLQTANGDLWYSTTMIGVKDGSGKIAQLVGISRDITQYKLSEEQLRKSKEKAEQADKLKSTFLANMSHEIRTPINGILGFANLMELREFPRDKEIEYLHIINNSGKLLLSLINDIIDIAKIEAGQINIEPSTVDLQNMLVDLLDFYQGEKIRRDKAHIEIRESHPANGQRYIETDPFRLRQIISNLINNSLKFTEKGIIEFGYTVEDLNVLFYVKDTGIGIAEDEVKVIFDRFKQAGCPSKKKEGTGLGLAISKGLVELLGGKIWVETSPDIGSNFYFTLPAKQNDHIPQMDAYEFKMSRMREINWEGKTLLLVEDEDVNYIYINELLQSTGINLLRVVTAEEAIQICQSQAHIDIILMDMRLPGINGFDATRLIKRIRREVPIVAQTAYAMENEKKLCLEAGCDHYMTKPFNQEVLFDVLNNFLEFSN